MRISGKIGGREAQVIVMDWKTGGWLRIYRECDVEGMSVVGHQRSFITAMFLSIINQGNFPILTYAVIELEGKGPIVDGKS